MNASLDAWITGNRLEIDELPERRRACESADGPRLSAATLETQ